uniref:Fatty acyl-CoA reductase n=1 Tax=Kalanchoe fedtschenkoi TaxID=63787 RepID=A0A7N0TRQ8_KALFE
METNFILENFFNKTVFVTGITGFLGKVFVEKILRIQPNVKKFFLLIRAADDASAVQRLRDELIPIVGDVSDPDLGLSANSRKMICQEADFIVNIAATTNFDERYDIALGINTFGVMHTMNMARECLKLQVFLHVSTAYVHGEKSGILTETTFSMGHTLDGTNHLSISNEKEIVDRKLDELKSQKCSQAEVKLAMKDLGLQRARTHGWPNTYVFTKSMGEMLLGELKGDVPLVIIRPTIVTSTYKDPFPGWIEGFRTVDAFAYSLAQGKMKFITADPHLILDVNSCDPMIYQIGSSIRNPTKITAIRVGKFEIVPSMEDFYMRIARWHILPLKVIKLVNIVMCHYMNDYCQKVERKLQFIVRLMELYRDYLCFKGRFDDKNTQELRGEMRSGISSSCSDENAIYLEFDPMGIDWTDYFMNTHIPGSVKYVFK